MKKFLPVLLILLGNVFSASATHLMGGEIIATQLHDSTYQVTLTVYRDTLGIPMDNIAHFKVRDASGTVIMNFNTPQDLSVSGTLLPLYPYGVEIYSFVDTIVLPGPGTYHISFEDCCRNGAIQNMTAPLSENMYLTTTITYFSSSVNSTPFFLVRPVIFLPVNTPWNYNPLPFDAEGDSLVYRLDTPYTDHMTNVAGFLTPAATTSGPFVIDPVTSTISWTASTIGNFDATVLTEEYRNGVKIGEIRRDMQFIVVAPGSSMPSFMNLSEIPTDPDGNLHVGLLAGERYAFGLLADDPDSGQTVNIEAFGEPFLFANSPAKFSVRKTGKTYGNEVEGTFEWIPLESMARPKPYMVVYRVNDGVFANDQTVLYNVYNSVPPTGINNENKRGNEFGRLYPNPAQSEINIPVNFSRQMKIEGGIYNMSGILVHSLGTRTVSEGSANWKFPVDLSSGQYMIVFRNGEELLDVQQLTIIHN